MSAALDAEQQSSGWVMVPNSIARNSGLGVYAKAVLLALASHSEGWAVTVEHLAKEADVSESSCRRAIAQLRERHLIEVQEQHGRIGQLASIYTVTLGNQVPVPQTVSEPLAPVIKLPVPQTITPDCPTDRQETVTQTSTIRRKDHALKDQEPKVAARRQVPEDWRPDDEAAARLLADGFTQRQIDYELPKFVDHHRAKGSTFLRIDAAFRNWMRNAREFAKQRTPRSRQPEGQQAIVTDYTNMNAASRRWMEPVDHD